MKIIIFTLFFLFLVPILSPIYTIVDPNSVPNNKFGIHIIDENDLDNAAKLVNSSGGDWGYIVIVLPDNERNTGKWQVIFDKMSRLHLIPIIRLATHLEGNVWVKPDIENAKDWADFLSSLDWVIKNRYIVLFNEPNHAKEWGGEVNPREYADTVEAYGRAFKDNSSDYFILPAGLDASAPDSHETMDEYRFLSEVKNYKPSIFNLIDGWTSHSYPNPGFTGSVGDQGKGTLQTYKWELQTLTSWGINKQYDVFITETGWPHREGISVSGKFYPSETVARYTTETASTIWADSRIMAVTPFVLNYQSYPFANFSWQKPQREDFYPQFSAYQKIAKTAGLPVMNPVQLPSISDSLEKLTVPSFYQFTSLKDLYLSKFIRFAPSAPSLSFFKGQKFISDGI